MHTKIARTLLEGIHFEVSAIVALGEQKEIISVGLFSTDYPEDRLCIPKGAKEVWLITNHPEGNQMLYEQDIVNYNALLRKAGRYTVRLFLSSEYFTCFEIKGLANREHVI